MHLLSTAARGSARLCHSVLGEQAVMAADACLPPANHRSAVLNARSTWHVSGMMDLMLRPRRLRAPADRAVGPPPAANPDMLYGPQALHRVVRRALVAEAERRWPQMPDVCVVCRRPEVGPELLQSEVPDGALLGDMAQQVTNGRIQARPDRSTRALSSNSWVLPGTPNSTDPQMMPQ